MNFLQKILKSLERTPKTRKPSWSEWMSATSTRHKKRAAQASAKKAQPNCNYMQKSRDRSEGRTMCAICKEEWRRVKGYCKNRTCCADLRSFPLYDLAPERSILDYPEIIERRKRRAEIASKLDKISR